MKQQAPSSRFRIAGTLLALLVLGTVGAMKWLQAKSLAREASQRRAVVAAGPRIRTVLVRADGDGVPMAIQGETLPAATTTLYAKIGGFVKEIRVDKGSQVHKGQVLAILESPETDKQTLALKATAENAQRSADRLVQLGKAGIANAQDVDNAVAAARVAKEQWAAQQLTQAYEKVLAPFSGVITARMVDVGAFIQNASGSTSVQPMMSVADPSHLRVDFFLDQATASLAKVGQAVQVSPADRPDVVRSVRINRLAGTLELRTRTMLAEADLDNRDGAFLGGGYVNVALQLPKGTGVIDIPSTAIIMHGPNAFAAAVAGGRVKLMPLALGVDVGNRVRVLKGLQSGDRIILSPAAGLKDGDAVQVMDS
jgi:RND family efflux transporter MFP subunit